jgi:hypothetical protein
LRRRLKMECWHLATFCRKVAKTSTIIFLPKLLKQEILLYFCENVSRIQENMIVSGIVSSKSGWQNHFHTSSYGIIIRSPMASEQILAYSNFGIRERFFHRKFDEIRSNTILFYCILPILMNFFIELDKKLCQIDYSGYIFTKI